jgi:hypothetical protein
VKVAGFTFIRNAVKYDYPITEAISSILPLCDEVIVNVGNSEDDTAQLIQSIASPKIKISYSEWDESLKEGGRVLAAETDKAFELAPADADWCMYIQGDEVIHEKYYGIIRKAMEQYKDDHNVEGLLFKYLHFYGSYDYIGDSRTWYSHEIRVIRNNKAIRSYRDAQGFRLNGKKLQVKPIEAYIYHYGWVKDPRRQLQKHLNFEKLYNTTNIANEVIEKNLHGFDYSQIDSLQKFTGTHPATMQPRIQQKNWTIDLDITKKRFTLKDRLLYWIEKKTGKRLFAYENYKII